ncbi:uncharacterized protein LOC130437246 isoform X2 [Triplophysa dalaica]|uniref:uncharacterized protein LOC130417993 isoform X2 n=1 Tax=Triplophysa dalaica TaxID=1582913 RepID=UPI0024DFB0DB|nr:uncharacterized protein LOC130417993 isoform X2 [Triplophysa dalaica]XP_056607046.1 uncharacterized protein LOC130425034 isoform X2 [Triplophysa dalaica]XP_056622642.1 uncharacterized protein LOC130435811 isoform X2 [Triplophysa dalaica]XP_056624527.1 uncharacterized protein LOC130437246 isoform X2 [Triplophysa dalaica]
MATKQYAVVEFSDDNSVEIVPTSWLEESKEGKIFCYWTFSNVRQLVKGCSLPDRINWRKLQLKKIWLKTGSYSTAVEKCSRVVETSNIETEDTTRTKKRAQKKPKRFLSEKDSSSSDDCRVLAKKKSEKSICKPVPPKYTPLSKTPLDMDNNDISSGCSVNSEESLQKYPQQSVSYNLQVAKELLLEEPQSSSEAATKNYRTKVLQKLQDIVENQQEILAMQRQLLASTAVMVVEDGGDLLHNGPCQTVEELQLLDSELAHKDKQIKMMNYLRSLGGLNPGAAVRKMLRKIALNEVLGAYSLKGKKNKKAFQDLQICNLVIGATQKNFRKLRATDVEDEISLVLKYAPHRHLK